MMTGRLTAWASRAVVAVYPQHIRERYGEEIVDLLLASPTPARDLANVVWCATWEHGGKFTMSHLFRPAMRVAGLVTVPFAVMTAWLLLFQLEKIIVNNLPEPTAERWLLILVLWLPAIVIFPLVLWLAWRLGRRSVLAWPVVLVPACLAFGCLPVVGLLFGERWEGSIPAILVWFAGMVAIGGAARLLASRSGGRRVFIYPPLMALALLDLAIAAYITIVFPIAGGKATFSDAFLWYTVSWVEGGSTVIETSLQFLPQVLTVLTMFTLAWQVASATQPRPVVEDADRIPGTTLAPTGPS